MDRWAAILEELRLRLAEPAYDSYLRLTSLAGDDGEVLTVKTPHPFVSEMLERRMLSVISQVAAEVLGQDVKIEFQPRPAPKVNDNLEPLSYASYFNKPVSYKPFFDRPRRRTAPRTHLQDLDREGLAEWLKAWGHDWPERFLAIYGVEVVREQLVEIAGPWGDRAVDAHPARLVDNVRRAAASPPASTPPDRQPKPRRRRRGRPRTARRAARPQGSKNRGSRPPLDSPEPGA